MTARSLVAHLSVTFVLAVLSAAGATGLTNLVARGSLRPDWPVAFSVAAVLGALAVVRHVAATGRGKCASEN